MKKVVENLIKMCKVQKILQKSLKFVEKWQNIDKNYEKHWVKIW